MTLKVFREGINGLRNDQGPYRPVLTETKGVLNLVIGALQFTASIGMKLSSDPYYNKKLADRHVTIGFEAWETACKQLTPSMIVGGVCCAYIVRNWDYFSSNTSGYP